jgi:hypothetical protein
MIPSACPPVTCQLGSFSLSRNHRGVLGKGAQRTIFAGSSFGPPGKPPPMPGIPPPPPPGNPPGKPLILVFSFGRVVAYQETDSSMKGRRSVGFATQAAMQQSGNGKSKCRGGSLIRARLRRKRRHFFGSTAVLDRLPCVTYTNSRNTSPRRGIVVLSAVLLDSEVDTICAMLSGSWRSCTIHIYKFSQHKRT